MVTAALAALTLGLGIAPAFAQYGGYDEDYRPRRRFEERYDDRPRYRGEEYERPRYRGEGYGRGPGYDGGRIGRMCVTARGNCPTRPAPVNASCGCEIPGFGFKRGAIGY
nr:hypothetical protein [Methylobacterium crusticola]